MLGPPEGLFPARPLQTPADTGGQHPTLALSEPGAKDGLSSPPNSCREILWHAKIPCSMRSGAGTRGNSSLTSGTGTTPQPAWQAVPRAQNLGMVAVCSPTGGRGGLLRLEAVPPPSCAGGHIARYKVAKRRVEGREGVSRGRMGEMEAFGVCHRGMALASSENTWVANAVCRRGSAQPARWAMKARLDELRTRMDAIKQTKKVINAMRMVSAARIKQTARSTLHARPFANRVQSVLVKVLNRIQFFDGRAPETLIAEARRSLVRRDPEKEAMLDKLAFCLRSDRDVLMRPGAKSTLLVVASDKGMCGVFNKRIIAEAEDRIRQLQGFGVQIQLVVVGNVARNYFENHWPDINLQRSYECAKLNQIPDFADELKDMLMADFFAGNVDAVEVVYTNFGSLSSSTPVVRPLLPLTPSGVADSEHKEIEISTSNGKLTADSWSSRGVDKVQDIEFDQHPAEILASMVPLYLNSQLVRSLRESLAAELASRLQATNASLDNAERMSKELKSQFNKERQERITNELMEIVGGIGDVTIDRNLM